MEELAGWLTAKAERPAETFRPGGNKGVS